MFTVYRMLFLALNKVQIVKITPRQIPSNPIKIFLHSKICNSTHSGGVSTYPWTLFGKNLNCPFAPQKDFWKKMTKVKITFVYLLCSIMLKKFLQQIMKHKVA